MKRNFMVLILTLLVALTTVGMAQGSSIADLLNCWSSAVLR